MWFLFQFVTKSLTTTQVKCTTTCYSARRNDLWPFADIIIHYFYICLHLFWIVSNCKRIIIKYIHVIGNCRRLRTRARTFLPVNNFIYMLRAFNSTFSIHVKLSVVNGFQVAFLAIYEYYIYFKCWFCHENVNLIVFFPFFYSFVNDFHVFRNFWVW